MRIFLYNKDIAMNMEFEKPEYKHPKPEELSDEYVKIPLSEKAVNKEGKIFEKVTRENVEEMRSDFDAFFEMLENAVNRVDFNMISKDRIEEEMKKVIELAENLKREVRGLKNEPDQVILERSRELISFLSIAEDMGYRILETLKETGDTNFKGSKEQVRELQEETAAFRELLKKFQDEYEPSLAEAENYIGDLEILEKRVRMHKQ